MAEVGKDLQGHGVQAGSDCEARRDSRVAGGWNQLGILSGTSSGQEGMGQEFLHGKAMRIWREKPPLQVSKSDENTARISQSQSSFPAGITLCYPTAWKFPAQFPASRKEINILIFLGISSLEGL